MVDACTGVVGDTPRETIMKLQANAKLTPRTRLELVRSVQTGNKTVAQAARDLGVSQMTAFKWLARYRAEGEAGLADRSSRPATLRAATPARGVKQSERLRRQRLTMARIALQTGVSTSTVERILRRAGMSRLKNLDPEEPVIRYERALPGELIHIDTKKLGCIGRVGHRITGDRTGRVRGIGWETVFIAIDDHSRLAFAEVTDGLESRETASAFMTRALAYFAKLGVRVSQVIDRQRQSVRLPRLPGRARPQRHPSPANPTVHATHQWQGGALHSIGVARMGLRLRLPQLRTAHQTVGSLAASLQLASTARRYRRSPAHLAPRSAHQ